MLMTTGVNFGDSDSARTDIIRDALARAHLAQTDARARGRGIVQAMIQFVQLVIAVGAPVQPEFSPVQLLPLLLVIPLIAFWIWMFRDMLNNANIPDTARNGWIIAFIFLNVFAAVVYYVYEYRNKR